jgi:hypothetical protein
MKLFQNSIDAQQNASQHAKCFITMQTSFVSDNQSSAVVEPCETPLDAPSLGVTCRRETRRLTALPAMFVLSGRNTSFDSAILVLARPRPLFGDGKSISERILRIVLKV